MKTDRKLWLDEYAVTCRVFKGRWSIRHCIRMYNDISDLKVKMSSRASGKFRRYESAYNPCKRCKVMENYLKRQHDSRHHFRGPRDRSCNEVWAV